MIRCYDFEDGKYTVFREDTTYEVKINRNGERWYVMEDQMRYCKFFHAMLNKIDEIVQWEDSDDV